MANLSTQPYKGARDFYPGDARLQRYIFETWAKVAESFGYERYDAPLIEPTDLYRAKTGEEIVNEQTYTFTDRGGREVTVRPEMTPSVARMVAARQQELAFPLRWYSIVNNWRYERPQRGRGREFWQLNVDLLGEASAQADAEVIIVADAIMRALKASPDMYVIKINNRKLISLLLGEYLELDVEKSKLLSRLIDRKTKMSDEAFANQAQAIVGENTDKLLDLLKVKNIEELPANVVESGQVEELRALFSELDKRGVKNYRFDITIMRGFEYYTGMVFEVFDTDPENSRSLFGGGRYDGLTEIFNAPSVPAVGFAPSDISIFNFLETHQLLPELPSTTKVLVATIGETSDAAQKLATDLRNAGINVAVEASDRRLDAKIKKAVKDQISYAIFVGSEEAKSQKFKLKDLATEKEETLAIDEILHKLKQ